MYFLLATPPSPIQTCVITWHSYDIVSLLDRKSELTFTVVEPRGPVQLCETVARKESDNNLHHR